MPSAGIASDDLTSVCLGFEQLLTDYPPEVREAGSQLFAQLSTPNWAMEWSLPRWLGERFHIENGLCTELVQANVFGLAYVKLIDNLADLESNDSPAVAAALSAVLYQGALRLYASRFEPASPFWDHFGECLRRWIRATARSNHVEDDLPGGATGWESLADLGAPLKIGVGAACLLGHRQDLIPAVSSIVDRYVAAAVLLDHYADWQLDLQSGRRNHFIEALAPGAQQLLPVGEARAKVLEEILLGESVRDYLDRPFGLLSEAAAASVAINSKPLTEFLDTFLRSTRERTEAHRSDLRAKLRTTTRLLFGAEPVAEE